jgi:hypothetical protein
MRIMLVLAVAIMIGPSLVYGSSACMTENEARTKFPKAHLYGIAANIAGMTVRDTLLAHPQMYDPQSH